MKNKKSIRQGGAVLLIALMLAAFTLSGLNAFVLAEDAKTEVQVAAQADLPKDSAVDIVWETYENYPADMSQDLEDFYQGHGLTQKEKKRLTALRETFAAGTRPKGRVSCVPHDTGFAVVALQPADFAGMAEYFFLPNRELTDEELLELIAYGEENGRPFTGDTLSVKNCMRGGAVEVNRMRSAGEDARRTILFKRFTQEGLRAEGEIPVADISSPISGITDVRLNMDAHNGLDSFRFYPIREVTDEEILIDLYANSNGYYLDPVKEGLNLSADTDKARNLIDDVMGMPMATEASRLCYNRGETEGSVILEATFHTPKINGRETYYWVELDVKSGQCKSIGETTMDDSLYYLNTDGLLEIKELKLVKGNMNDERLAESALAMVAKVTSVKAVKVDPITDRDIGDTHDSGAILAIRMEDGSAWEAAVRYSDFKVCSLYYYPDGKTPFEGAPVNQ